ncbi:MAG: hypothetical protein NDJ90_11105 [Oligoflexia bacterium]|nr:hypothetical protein [Oligoflexia bacterium]
MNTSSNPTERPKGILLAALMSLACLMAGSTALAGTFNLAHFVEPGGFAAGLEPELTLTNGAALGVQGRFTYGLNELMNVGALVGTSGGDRRFRAGANTVLDFFPDIEGQPGIGVALTGVYYRLADSGQFEVNGVPYIHKTFLTGNNEVEPFLAIPVGMAFHDGRYRALAALNVGAMFKSTEKFRYVLELGVAVNNTDSFVSGGVVYYH